MFTRAVWVREQYHADAFLGLLDELEHVRLAGGKSIDDDAFGFDSASDRDQVGFSFDHNHFL
jgi:hypothetical protein